VTYVEVDRVPEDGRLNQGRPDQPALPAVTIRDLVRAALRRRPDRIILGEVRGGEAFELLQALNRLASCVLQSRVELPYAAIRSAIADSIQLVMHIARRDGRRTVDELLRIDGYDHAGETYRLRTLYRRMEVVDA
jgi:pilus assembly protein CpaF